MTHLQRWERGDRFPVTRDGRLVAIGLMLAGIALIGTVTAAIASWLVARVRDVERDVETDLTQELTALRREIADLKALLAGPPAPSREASTS
jgi:voltage-gated potassium channel